MIPPSGVQILIDNEDVTNRVLYERTRFRSQANAIPGDFTIAVRDDDHSYVPRAGAKVQLFIDNQVMFGGYVKYRGRSHWFPAEDTTDPMDMPRLWIIRGPDANILFDRRVLHDTGYNGYDSNFDPIPPSPVDNFKRLDEPGGPLRVMVEYCITRYTDMVQWIWDNEEHTSGHYEFEVGWNWDSSTGRTYAGEKVPDYPEGLFVGPGKYLREQMDDFAQYGGMRYTIDGEWNVHIDPYDNLFTGWGFSDYMPFGRHPNLGVFDPEAPSTYRNVWCGFREASYDEDFMQAVTQALVWGGSTLHKAGTDPEGDEIEGTVFAMYPDPPANSYRIPGSRAWKSRLARSVGPTGTEIEVTSVTGIPAINSNGQGNLDITIDDEKMFAYERHGKVLKVLRGTVPDSHKAKAKVIHYAEDDVILSKKKEQDALDRIDSYGLWQRAEMRPGQEMYLTQESVRLRAYTIVAGAPGTDTATGIDSGQNKPQPSMRLAWFSHDVPHFEGEAGTHLKAGWLSDFQLYTMGTDLHHPLVFTLPCRSLEISFPTLPTENPDHEMLTYVRFDGEFGLALTDSRSLWRYLMKRQRQSVEGASLTHSTVDNDSSGSITGSKGRFHPTEDPDGSRVTFTIPYGYFSGSTQVYLNGLLQRVNLEYKETDPGDGEIRFFAPPYADDVIWIVCTVNSH